MAWEATTGGSPGVLSEIRALLPEPIDVAMPSTPGAIFERVVPHLALADVVPADATVHAIAVSVDASAGLVAGVRLASVSEGAELAPGLPLLDGAPHGGRWVGEPPGASSPAAMVLGDVLIASDHPATLALGAPYVAWAVARGGAGGDDDEESSPGITVRFPETFAGRSLRSIVEARVETWASGARESIGRERARHEAPPAFGDPEALVSLAEERAREWLAYLPDAGEVRVTAQPSQVGLVVRLSARVTAGSPLARALDAQRAVEPEALLTLPDGVAGAWISGGDAGDDPSLARETIERLGGERLDEEARAGLAAAETSIRSSEMAITALGTTGGSPWLAVAARPSLDAESLRSALGAAFVRDVGGALLGCESALAPAAFRDEAQARVSPLCARRPGASDGDALAPPILLSATAEGAAAIAVARTDASSLGIVTGTARRLGGDAAAAGGAGSSPDIARTVAALDDPAIAAVLVVPSRLFGAATLLPAFGRAGSDGGRPAPIGWSVSRTEEGLRVTIVATEDALEDLAALLAPFLAD